MNTLRWALGIVLALLGGGYLALLVFSNGFRRSFGASGNSILFVILPLAAMAMLFAPLVLPTNRTLLHLGAIAAVAMIGLCLWQIISDSAIVLWFAILYLVLWLWFYASTAWGK
jgi:hypothetical protein